MVVDYGIGGKVNATCDYRTDCGDVSCVDNSYPTCSYEGRCVCKSSHYHIAMDENLEAGNNTTPSAFDIKTEADVVDGSWVESPLWTEPNWSADVGVVIFNDGSLWSHQIYLIVGCLFIIAGFFWFSMKSVELLKKEKIL